MEFISVLLIAVALAMDALTVAIASGLIIKNITFRHVFRIGFHFGLFQFLMPIIGWFAGTTIKDFIEAFDHWIAFSLLAVIGIRMIHNAFQLEEHKSKKDPSHGWTLILLSVATSIDALAVGLSLSLVNEPILYPSIIIGITALILSSLGVRFGSYLGSVFQKKIEIAGGIILIGIGIRIVIEHLFYM